MKRQEETLFTPEQKFNWWGDGLWIHEPDLVTFEHEGVECKAMRVIAKERRTQEHVFGGHFCGYCAIPEGHPWFAKTYDDIECDVHGGLTYSRLNDDGKWWVGFDCGHSTDLIPSMGALDETYAEMIMPMKELKEQFPESLLFNPVYRDVGYVIKQLESVAKQIKESSHE